MNRFTHRMLLSTAPVAALLLIVLVWAWHADISGARAGTSLDFSEQDAADQAQRANARHQREHLLIARQNQGSLNTLEAAELRSLREQDRTDLVGQ